MRLFIILFSLSLALGLQAQGSFTDRLTRNKAGEGSVTIEQDAEIADLVNGIKVNPMRSARRRATESRSTRVAQPVSPTTSDVPTNVESSEFAGAAPETTEATDSLSMSEVLGRKVRMNGFRIQVYAGGNNRKAKLEALRMGNRVRETFDDVTVYTHFISPRWVCRVGDFRTYEEASELLRKMQLTDKFREATIVKSKIIVYN